MAVGPDELPVLHPVAGVRVGTVCAGMRKPGRRDLALFVLSEQAQVAAVFTRNAFRAAPVLVAEEYLSVAAPRALLVNTGSANAGTGAAGIADARRCCAAVAGLLGLDEHHVLPFSTGVIGEPLPVQRLTAGLPGAVEALEEDGWAQAAEAIMTTDTRPKGASRQIEVDGRRFTITGISKGAGMIRPDMATMLAFVATDAPVERADLEVLLRQVTQHSFNRISVDGDTSTNDACCLIATGAAGGAVVRPGEPAWEAFAGAVEDVCVALARAIVRDGEGATRFITLDVQGAASESEARQVADAVAHSPLVKTAFFAGDPNWGRILAAVGRAGIGDLVLERVDIALDDVEVVRGGGLSPDYTEAAGAEVMAREEITVHIRLGRGDASTCVWTCDLSYDYVRINAEYRS